VDFCFAYAYDILHDNKNIILADFHIHYSICLCLYGEPAKTVLKNNLNIMNCFELQTIEFFFFQKNLLNHITLQLYLFFL